MHGLKSSQGNSLMRFNFKDGSAGTSLYNIDHSQAKPDLLFHVSKSDPAWPDIVGFGELKPDFNKTTLDAAIGQLHSRCSNLFNFQNDREFAVGFVGTLEKIHFFQFSAGGDALYSGGIDFSLVDANCLGLQLLVGYLLADPADLGYKQVFIPPNLTFPDGKSVKDFQLVYRKSHTSDQLQYSDLVYYAKLSPCEEEESADVVIKASKSLEEREKLILLENAHVQNVPRVVKEIGSEIKLQIDKFGYVLIPWKSF
jgi:hypothetical protein